MHLNFPANVRKNALEEGKDALTAAMAAQVEEKTQPSTVGYGIRSELESNPRCLCDESSRDCGAVWR